MPSPNKMHHINIFADDDSDIEKKLAIYEQGVPDETLLDREQVKRLVAEGKL